MDMDLNALIMGVAGAALVRMAWNWRHRRRRRALRVKQRAARKTVRPGLRIVLPGNKPFRHEGEIDGLHVFSAGYEYAICVLCASNGWVHSASVAECNTAMGRIYHRVHGNRRPGAAWTDDDVRLFLEGVALFAVERLELADVVAMKAHGGTK